MENKLALLIDDSPKDLLELTKPLQGNKFSVEVAKSIEEAIQSFASLVDRISLLVVDLKLPERHGSELIENGGIELVQRISNIEEYHKACLNIDVFFTSNEIKIKSYKRHKFVLRFRNVEFWDKGDLTTRNIRRRSEHWNFKRYESTS